MRWQLCAAAAPVFAGLPVAPDADSTGITSTDCPGWQSAHVETASQTVTEDGTVIEYEAVQGRLRIQAANVTLRCLTIDADGALYGIHCDSRDGGCPGLRVENVEVTNCDSACVLPAGAENNPVVIRRAHVHNSKGDLVKATSNLVIEASYLHGFNPAPGAHNDALQTSGGSNIELRGNRIDGPFQAQTSAYIVKPDFAPIDNVVIESNWLSGGAYTVYLRDSSSHPAPTNVRIVNNVWIRDSWQFGPLSSDTSLESCLEWTDNHYDDGSPYAGPQHGRAIGECNITTFGIVDAIFSDGFE